MSVYEQPLNEKIRLFMRLTHLMQRFKFHLETPTPENCQAAVMVLLELYNLSSRLDVKNSALHVLDWQAQEIHQNRDVDDAERVRAESLLKKLEETSKKLYSFNGQLGQHLKTHNFMSKLKQRASIAGGVNGLDIPLFNYWLSTSEKNRVNDLESWIRPYNIVFDAIQLLTELIYRDSEVEQVVAGSGFYQATLSPEKEYQVLSVTLPDNVTYYPEISAGKQRFSIRFVNAESLEEKGKQIIENVNFTLTLYSY